MNDAITPDDDGDRLIGQELDGRFRIDALLGEGGMGKVYRGCQLSVERDVAIKVLHGELSLDEELRARFFREAQVVSNLSHPHIVRLIDFGRDEETGLLYLVMELIDGYGLDELIERGRLKPEFALRIAYQTCGALVEAHGADVIHRDMKAENLLLQPVSDGTLQTKVVDFGIAYPREASEKLTMTGRVYGTASYMAPEQARGETVDERADLFSVGIMLFEMLVGRLPIEGGNSIDVLIRQIKDGPPPLGDVVPPGTFPEGVVDLVDRLITTDPERRPSSAAEIRKDLEAIFAQEGWGPIRLETDRKGLEMFTPWIETPIAFRQGDVDEELPPTDDGAKPGAGEPSPEESGTEAQWGDAESETVDATPDAPSAAAALDGGGPTVPDEGPSDDTGTNRLLVLVAVGIGIAVLGAIGVGGYFALQYFQPEANGLDEVATPGAASEETEATDEDEAADEATAADEEESETSPVGDPETDPVCGEIERADLPEAWRGSYKPQGDGDAGLELKLSGDKLNVRWESGGATIFLAQTSRDGSTYKVECARYVGTGDGKTCSGSLRRHGPVLVGAFQGTDVCETRLSGPWMAD